VQENYGVVTIRRY